nr:immunoglobulin light chain junction region [Macaca mulatta]MOW36298.1 immunoglobulin light chain junction region [Macaca mulatta]MOW36401.1 immunoglobulin light chain junction region [Macaca mulatta]MOW36430.1 immunoglobulin light chain junction region [Macaca mulatta]MOW36855.1 immunoglobulin light chain junction region [Macaca mulatta]
DYYCMIWHSYAVLF